MLHDISKKNQYLLPSLFLVSSVIIGVVTAVSPLWAAIALSVLIFFVVAMRFPSLCLFLVVMTAPLLNIGITIKNPVRHKPEFIGISAVFMLTALLIYFLRNAFFVRNSANDGKYGQAVNLLFILFFSYAITGLLWTGDIYHGVEELFLILMCFLLLKTFPGLAKGPQTVQFLLKCIPLLSVILIAHVFLSESYPKLINYTYNLTNSISFTSSFHTIGTTNKIRPAGFAPVNMAADILAVMVFFHIIHIFQGKWIFKIFNAAIIFLLIFAILKTGSKAGIGALMAGVFSMPFVIPELRKKIIRMSVASFLFFSSVIALTGGLLIKRIEVGSSGKGGGGFLSQRLDWWEVGFKKLLDTFGLGAGTGGFPKLVDPVPGAHSMYFSALFDYGIIGIILLLSFLGVLICKIYKDLPHIADHNLRFSAYCLFCALIPIAIHGSVDMEFTYVMLWLILAFLLMIIKVSRKDQSVMANG